MSNRLTSAALHRRLRQLETKGGAAAEPLIISDAGAELHYGWFTVCSSIGHFEAERGACEPWAWFVKRVSKSIARPGLVTAHLSPKQEEEHAICR